MGAISTNRGAKITTQAGTDVSYDPGWKYARITNTHATVDITIEWTNAVLQTATVAAGEVFEFPFIGIAYHDIQVKATGSSATVFQVF